VPEYKSVFRQLGGWPLPTMADGNALHVTRTKAFSAVEIQKTLEKRLFAICFPVSPQGTELAFKDSGIEENREKRLLEISFSVRSLKRERLEAL
jgi:hypothetical protein